MDIAKILETVEEKNLSIKDVKIKDLIPNAIEDVIIAFINDEVQLHFGKDLSGERFKKWKNGRGGVFYQDVKNWKNKKNHGNYVILNGNGEDRTIARLIEEEEVETFDMLKLIDGKIKDKPYMKFRVIGEGEKLTKSDRYIEKSNEDMASEYKIILPNHIASNDEVNTDQEGNVSLFND